MRRVLGTSIVFVVCVILWGAYVRASGSGAGCGDHWPLCHGNVVPDLVRRSTAIEFTHRVTSGISFILVEVIAIIAFFKYPLQRRLALLVGISMLFEALLGAFLVLMKLVEHNPSLLRAFSGSIHLINTLVMVGALVKLYLVTLGRGNWGQRPMQGAVVSISVLFIALGVTGAMAALGDTLFPSLSFADGLRSDFEHASHVLLRIRILHPLGALFLAASAMPFAFLHAPRLGKSFCVLFLIHLAGACLNLILLAPVYLQLIHLASALALWALWVALVDELWHVS